MLRVLLRHLFEAIELQSPVMRVVGENPVLGKEQERFDVLYLRAKTRP